MKPSVAKKVAISIVAPYRARIAAIKPSLTTYTDFDFDFDLIESVMVARLTGTKSRQRDFDKLAERLVYFAESRAKALEIVAKVEREIEEWKQSPNQQAYLNLWRFHADVAICDAFLEADAACLSFAQGGQQ